MDHDLVLRAQRGDQQAFETLTIASHTRLYKAAHGILRDQHLAEDATQQAFIDIWKNIRRLRDASKFEGWSYRLLVHACYAEAKRKPGWLPDSELDSADEPLDRDDYGAVVVRDQLERGFEHLSLDHRAVIVLHHLLDMTLEQVAEALDIPQGTVHSRLNRAMTALRAGMDIEAGTVAAPPEPQEATR